MCPVLTMLGPHQRDLHADIRHIPSKHYEFLLTFLVQKTHDGVHEWAQRTHGGAALS